LFRYSFLLAQSPGGDPSNCKGTEKSAIFQSNKTKDEASILNSAKNAARRKELKHKNNPIKDSS